MKHSTNDANNKSRYNNVSAFALYKTNIIFEKMRKGLQ